MRLETFFEKFDLFADAHDAVAKVRELVLELAVKGGLVPHSTEEPPVPYDSIAGVTPINTIDTPGNWRVVLLADALKNRSGNSKLIKGKLHEEPAPGRFQGFSASGADVWCDNYEHEGPAIIVSAVGARCGKAFKASGKWSAIANTNITRPDPALFDFDFAYLVLNNEHFWVRGGSAQPFVKFPPSLDRHFAVPPLAEQKRVVAKVDELMALCDRLEVQQKEREMQHAALARASLARFVEAPIPANLDWIFHSSFSVPPSDLRKSILTLAVQGKLVPQDPNDEPAIDPDESDEELASQSSFEIPEGWAWARLSKLADINGGFAFKSTDYTEEGMRIVRISDFDEFGFKDHKVVRHRFTGDLTKFSLAQNNILMAMTGGTVGKSYLVRSLPEPMIVNQRVATIKVSGQANPDYVDVVIRSDMTQAVIRKAKNSTNDNISMGDIKRFAIPVPPLAEQRRIVAKVNELMALGDALEAQLDTARITGANLLAAAVAELSNGNEVHAAAEI